MKSQALSCSLVASAAREFGFNPKRDVLTIVERIAHEGEEFLSITLPRLDAALLEGLSSSTLPSLEGWSKKHRTKYPEFLQDLWCKIFDADGRILPDPSARAIYWIRQISVAFKKVFEVCDPDRVEEAIQHFFTTDLGLPRKLPASSCAVSDVAHWLFGKPVGRAISSWDSVYQNGPGAVADRLDVNERWDFPTISPHIEAAFGAERYRSSWGDLLFHYPLIREVPARLVAVPKTALKPRLISIEPSHNQYLQQSLMSTLYDELTQIWAVDIRKQEPNQRLAREGSRDRSLATIDLSEASDRISFELVQSMFSWNPAFVTFLEATRSREVVTPDGRNFHLRKFASMGSALTFPVETMVFTTLAITAMCIQGGDVSKQNALRHLNSARVRVYGDDIIVPTQYFQSVCQILGEYGLKVNSAKSFATGFFRESCGKDYYRGYDVTPIYVRRKLPNGHLPWDASISLVAFHNQLWLAQGDIETTSLIKEMLKETLPGLPTLYANWSTRQDDWRGSRVSGYLPFELAVGGLYLLGSEECGRFRWNAELQIQQVQTYFLRAKSPETRGTHRAKLLKALAGPKSEDADRLFRGGRPQSAKLTMGWRTVR